MSTPNPGSPEAVAIGCKCDQERNRNGEGEPLPSGAHRYHISMKCPVHSDFFKENPDEQP